MGEFMRILAIGDCNTSGVEDAPSENLPEELCKIFRQNGYDIEIFNEGHAMTTTREGVAKIKQFWSLRGERTVDIVLINFGLVDSWVVALPSWYISYYPDNIFKKYARKLLKSFKKRLRNPAVRRFLPTGNTVPMVEFRKNYQYMIDYVRRFSPQARIILWGIAPTRYDMKREIHIKAYDEVIKELATSNGCIHIDTRQIFEPYTSEQLYRDHVHINSFAQKLLAGHIYNAVKKID